MAYLLLTTTIGPTHWRHHVLLVGAVASVRVTAASERAVGICRTLVAFPALHDTADFGGAEEERTALSAFWGYQISNVIVGLQIKVPKQNGLASRHQVQGTIITFAPTPGMANKSGEVINRPVVNRDGTGGPHGR